MKKNRLVNPLYEKRLTETNILRGYQTVFIIFHDHDDSDITIVFKLKYIITKWRNVTLVKEKCRLVIRKYTFSKQIN